ncbi:heavy metal-associated isoprenylated plant protein 19 [Neltuma alba]|uniref:heavy metal-associated isoprenylated plant protein 19 n=1 Tax=Neltuma alba TaxID=207710 RepID=UPI0010A315A3|nr:heavy metal-associated isoprenylated plant protein 19 [Prosopis alba]
MGKSQKHDQTKVIVIEFKVSMHCNACERSVAKAISKCKGVEKFTTDMKKHRVVVTGQIDPKKVLKKLKKKTGKKVEIVGNKNKGAEDERDKTDLNSGLVLMNPFMHQVDGCLDTRVLIKEQKTGPGIKPVETVG